jgi:hypothetical protein
MADFKVQKILRYDSLAARAYSENYLSEKTNCGQLFVVLELPKTERFDQQILIDELINLCSTLFLSSKNTDPNSLLEDIIKKVNEILPDLNARSRMRNWLQTLDMAFGIIQANSVCFTNIGHMEAWLISHNRLEQVAAKNEHINPAKVFSETINGNLEEGDSLIVSTSSLLDYLAKEKIRQLVKKYTPQSAATKIQLLLQTVPDFVTFNSLIIKNSSDADHELRADEIMPIAEQSENTKSDIIQATSKSVGAPARTKTVIDLRVAKKITPIRRIVKFFILAGYYFVLVYKTIKFIFLEIKKAILFLFSKKYRQNKEDEAISQVKSQLYTRYNWWRNLNKVKKISVIGLVITLLLFIQGTVYLTQKKSVEKKDQVYQQIIQGISAKFAEADAKLIYNDEIAAEQILMDIEKSLDDFQAAKPEQQSEINSIREKTTRELNKVRHIYEVPNPLELANLASILAPRQIVQKNGKFYILGQDKLYAYDNKEIIALADFGDGVLLSDWPNKEQLLLSKTDSHAIYSIADKKITNLDLKKPEEKSSIVELNIYGNNLYALDNGTSQIYKYPEQGSAFGNPTPWIKDSTKINEASSFAIDGSVYFTQNNGEIIKLTKGNKDVFNYHVPRPIIGAKSSVQTFKDAKYLYVLDPQHKRIIIFSKDGSIKNQYTSNSFDDLRDLAIDPEEKAIYLLNGQHLYLLAVEQ